MQSVLNHFHLNNAQPYGEGIESRVYILDSTHVLRICKGNTPDEMAERQFLYDIVARGSYPYAVPELMEIGEISGIHYSIERFMPGVTIRLAFPSFSATHRNQVIRNFLGAIVPLQTANVADLPYGELIGQDKIQDTSWSNYLYRKSSGVLKSTQAKLGKDAPHLNRALEKFNAGLETLSTYSEKHLVHGDFYPAHLLLDNQAKISGLLDFSRLTIIGDPLLDYAEALSTFEDPLRPEGSAKNAKRCVQLIKNQLGEGALETIRIYQLYYAILFSDCEAYDPTTYSWCIRTLNGEIWPIT